MDMEICNIDTAGNDKINGEVPATPDIVPRVVVNSATVISRYLPSDDGYANIKQV